MVEKNKKTLKNKKKNFHLLPLVIFFCSLMLSLRIGVLWRSVMAPEKKTPTPVSFTAALAQEEAKNKPKEEPKPEEKAPSADDEKQEKASKPKRFSQAELEILQTLAKRREELDAREQSLDQRLGVLKAAEAQLDAKLFKMQELQREISDLIGVYGEKEKSRLDNLVKVYSTMKPKEAARLFNEMDMPLLVKLFERMKEAKSAPILAAMDTAKAGELTKELAVKRTLPGLDEAVALEQDKKSKQSKK